MSTVLLRIEATNFEWAIDDTGDLSTRRGGGLAMLHAAEAVAAAFAKDLRPVSLGASIGLFEVVARDPADVRDRVGALLRTGSGTPGDLARVLPHLTFVVNLIEATGDLTGDEQRLVAAGRWEQLRSPSLAPIAPSGAAPCALDKLRPRGEDPDQSDAVRERRKYGRDQKNRFYRQVLQVGGGTDQDLLDRVNAAGFVTDFGELATDNRDDALNGKMAVLYADGNRFGGRRAEGARRAPDQATALEFLRDFDRELRRLQRDFLAAVLATAARATQPTASDWRANDGAGPIRLETLLWGGDELLLVAPARVGWRLLRMFLNQPWSLTAGGSTEELTFKIGLVFCHHKAPIRRVSALAHALGDLAAGDRSAHLVAYEVLESFDHAGTDPAAARRTRAGALRDHLLITAGAAAILAEAAALRDGDLARGRVIDVVALARAGEDAGKADERLRRDLSPAERDLADRLLAEFAHPQAGWLHLAELWDYLDA